MEGEKPMCPYEAFMTVFEDHGIEFHLVSSHNGDPIAMTQEFGYTIMVYKNTIIINDAKMEQQQLMKSKTTFFSSVVQDLTTSQARKIAYNVAMCYVRGSSQVGLAICDHVEIVYDVVSLF